MDHVNNQTEFFSKLSWNSFIQLNQTLSHRQVAVLALLLAWPRSPRIHACNYRWWSLKYLVYWNFRIVHGQSIGTEMPCNTVECWSMITVHKNVLDEIRAGKNECWVEVTRLNREVTFQELLTVCEATTSSECACFLSPRYARVQCALVKFSFISIWQCNNVF